VSSNAYVSANAGDTWTAARVNDLPQGVLAKTTATANAGPTSGTTELDIITLTAITLNASDRRLLLKFYCRGYSCSNAGDLFTVRLKEGATTLTDGAYLPSATGVASIGAYLEVYIDSAATGSHTYKATIVRSIGSGTATVAGTATAPITISVMDVGKV
jgi:hypothetical protein